MTWHAERGIGELRAARIEGGAIAEARIWRDEDGPHAGAAVLARLHRILPRGRALALAADGTEILCDALAPGLTEGMEARVAITRAPIVERDEGGARVKRARGRAGHPDGADAGAADPVAVLETEGGHPVHRHPGAATSPLAAAGWDELMAEAQAGRVAFPSGTLLVHVTPAMTLVDVDGSGPPAALAERAAPAVAAAMARLAITGSVGIDFPDAGDRAGRNRIAAAFDAAAWFDCERTAVNGFGFMQVVRRRTGPSLVEVAQADHALTRLIAALREAERTPPPHLVTLRLDDAMRRHLDARPCWLAELGRRCGRAPLLEKAGARAAAPPSAAP